MTEQEYNEQLKQLNEEFQAARSRFLAAKRKLGSEYALSNNPYKVGDIVKDSQNRILRITNISVGYSSLQEKYMCVYTGMVLKKDLTPKMPEKLVETSFIKNTITSKD